MRGVLKLLVILDVTIKMIEYVMCKDLCIAKKKSVFCFLVLLQAKRLGKAISLWKLDCDYASNAPGRSAEYKLAVQPHRLL